MSEPIEPCAWCGKEPSTYNGKTFCTTFGCLTDVNCPRDLVNWNLWQKRSRSELEKRERAAFEAGFNAHREAPQPNYCCVSEYWNAYRAREEEK